jgi:hypothetical protein
MNKIKTSIVILIVGVLLVFLKFNFFRSSNLPGTNDVKIPVETPQISKNLTLNVIFDDKKEIKYVKENLDERVSVYDLLAEGLKKNNLEIEVKNYDFGVFVKSINGYESTAKKSWIYFINGKSGDIAADKYELKGGDLVEWKYITPTE